MAEFNYLCLTIMDFLLRYYIQTFNKNKWWWNYYWEWSSFVQMKGENEAKNIERNVLNNSKENKLAKLFIAYLESFTNKKIGFILKISKSKLKFEFVRYKCTRMRF